MDVKLVIEQGSDASKVFKLKTVETIVGRQSDCGLRIPSSAVSRKHCRLSFRDDVLSVEDLESANGTNVNGEPIEGERVLRPGDRLEVGPVTFLVKYQLTPAAIERLMSESEADDEIDVEPVEDEAEIPEVEVEELVTDDTDEVAAAKPPTAKPPTGKGKGTVKAPAKPAKPAPKPPAKKPAKTQEIKKPAKKDKKPAKPQDDSLDPDVAAMLDGDKSWHMPSNDDFRDFLTQMEDD